MVALRAEQLVKRFGTTCAVDHVDLEVRAGEVRGLLGPNGAGKTTLMRMLFGLIRPDSGAVEFFDRSTGGRLDGVGGFVEDPTFYPYLSGRANLELLAELDGSGAPSGPIEESLLRVGLNGSAGQKLSGYSTGMRQRLGIAAALLRSPRLLLLDEPTSGLDPAGARAITGLLRDLRTEGVAILLSSHLIGEVEAMCDTFTVLRRGQVVWDGTRAQLQAQASEPTYALVTSDDERALRMARESGGVRAARGPDDLLSITLDAADLDQFVLALGRAGIAVRRLELLVSPLESLFFSLTADDAHGEPEPERARPVDRTLART